MKKSVLLFALFFTPSFIFLVASCDPTTSCTCPPIQGAYFRTTGLEFELYDLLSSSFTPLDDSAQVNQQQLQMQLEFDVNYYSAKNPAPGLMDFTNSVYACSCVGNGDHGSEERIRDLEIITVNALDSLHPAGSSINDLLEFSQYGDPIALDELSTQQLYYPRLELHFKQLLAPVELQLQATMEMVDGTIYLAKTTTVHLN